MPPSESPHPWPIGFAAPSDRSASAQPCISEWESLGGGFTSAPAICSWGAGRLDIFGRGEDFALWHKWFDGAKWSDWETLGGSLTSPPAAVSWGAGRIDVFVRGTDRALWHKWFRDGGWRGWESLGGALNFGPAVSSRSSGRLDVFARGTDNRNRVSGHRSGLLRSRQNLPCLLGELGRWAPAYRQVLQRRHLAVPSEIRRLRRG